VLGLALAGVLFGLVIMVPGSGAGDFFRTSGAVWLVLICALMAASFLAAPAAFMTYRVVEREVRGGRGPAIVLAALFLVLVVTPWAGWSQSFVPDNPVDGIEWKFNVVVAAPVVAAFCAVLGLWRIQHGAPAATQEANYQLLRESLLRLTWILGALIGLSTLSLGAYLVANDRPELKANLVKIAGQLAELRANPPADPSKELEVLSKRIAILAPLGGEKPCWESAQGIEARLDRAASCVQVAALEPAAYYVDSALRLIGIRPLVNLVVGAYYTLLLGVAFVPAHLALQNAGRRIRDRTYPPLPLGADGYKARLDERSTADGVLGLDAGPGVALRQHVALLAPLAGGIVSALLAGRL